MLSKLNTTIQQSNDSLCCVHVSLVYVNECVLQELKRIIVESEIMKCVVVFSLHSNTQHTAHTHILSLYFCEYVCVYGRIFVFGLYTSPPYKHNTDKAIAIGLFLIESANKNSKL